MTESPLADLLHRAAEPLDPATADRILRSAVRAGERRRRRRQVAVVGTAAAATVVLTAGVAGTVHVAGQTALTAPATPAATGGGTGAGCAGEVVTPAPAGSPAAPSGAPPVVGGAPACALPDLGQPVPPVPSAPTTSYAPGSETEVPEGPVVPTDRAPAPDAALARTLTRLASAYGDVDGVGVAEVTTRTTGHVADRTREGRSIVFALDGAAASVTVQRWDGYVAVGADLPPGYAGGPLDDDDLVQTVDRTAAEACGRHFTCQQTPAGWYWVDRPSQGAAAPSSYRELLVTLFTEDGWVVRVDAYNTPAEKAGPPVAERPVLEVAESVALASSPGWFRSR